MKKILVLVEGQTEERFVKDIIRPHLNGFETNIIPKIVATKIEKSGDQFQGGLSNYRKVKRDLDRLLNDKSAMMVTTMFDYYGLPRDFPGYALKGDKRGAEAARYLESRFEDDVSSQKFFAYLQVHEFEGLLFSDPAAIAGALVDKAKLKDILGIRKKFKSPEDINDGPTTCPSRRIMDIFQSYQKPLHGSLIASRIGLGKIRSECLHFDEWLKKLERIK